MPKFVLTYRTPIGYRPGQPDVMARHLGRTLGPDRFHLGLGLTHIGLELTDRGFQFDDEGR